MRRFLPMIGAILAVFTVVFAMNIIMQCITLAQTTNIAVAAENAPLSPVELAKKYPVKGKLPTAVDLRKWAPTPGNQGDSGSCVAWATGYTMLGWYANKTGTHTTFAPMYLYAQTHLDNTKLGGGSTAYDTFTLLRDKGIDTKKDYTQGNFNFTVKPTHAEKINASKYKTTDFTTLYGTLNGNVGNKAKLAIEQVIASGNPVGLSIPAKNDFQYLTNRHYHWTLKDFTNDHSKTHLHYLAVLGYDKTGVWVENSWGTGWGLRGFAHLSWDFVTQKSYEAEAIHGFAH